MTKTTNKITIGIIAAITAITIIMTLNSGVQITQAANPELEFNRDNFHERQKISTTLALAHPQVKAITDTAFNYAADYHWFAKSFP